MFNDTLLAFYGAKLNKFIDGTNHRAATYATFFGKSGE
jgi:hypothetical protein